jgi:hypothetical protein
MTQLTADEVRNSTTEGLEPDDGKRPQSMELFKVCLEVDPRLRRQNVGLGVEDTEVAYTCEVVNRKLERMIIAASETEVEVDPVVDAGRAHEQHILRTNDALMNRAAQ